MSPIICLDCSEFYCANDTRICVPWNDVCDGRQHCLDQSDESENCWKDCHKVNLLEEDLTLLGLYSS